VRGHKLGVVVNKCTVHNNIVLPIFMPKIIKVGKSLTELCQKTILTFLRHGVQADRSLRSLSAWSLPQYRPALHYIFGFSGLNSVCGLDFGLRPQFSTLGALTRSIFLSSIMGAPVCVAALVIRHHGDDVYMTSQPIAAHSSAAAYEVWLQNFRKSNFFQTDDPSATSHLANVPAM